MEGAPLHFETVPVATPPGAPLAVELVPAPAPWAVAQKLAHLPHLLFLDSSEQHAQRGRYSYVTADPIESMSANAASPDGIQPNSLLLRLKEMLGGKVRHSFSDLPPFQGGLAGLFSYGFGREFERLPPVQADEFQCPDVFVGVFDWVISFDHEQNRAWVVSSGTVERLRTVVEHLRSPLEAPRGPDSPDRLPLSLPHQHPLSGFQHVTSNFDRTGYEAAVRRVVEYIRAGDCFQVNLSQRLLAPLREHPLELYGRLRQLNPAPFAAYFDMGDFQVLSASPERFLRVFPGGEVETRPIKGTRPRGATVEEDAALVRDLAASPKDHSENVMIVDLLRNDIGKVCEYGSVRVPRVCEVETFRYVHHLVSEVRGKLRPGLGPLDLLAAAFPGGSVTGAPKVRAMEIIAELEPTARGPYCGCLGWIGFDGAMDTNILIRTFTAGRGWVQFPVGGGIVAESDPAREYEETLHKAAGLLRALK